MNISNHYTWTTAWRDVYCRIETMFPETGGQYNVKGYPVLPAIFNLFTGFYVATIVYNDIDNYAKGRPIH